MKKTKIICSIGPASNKVEVMEQMVIAGMNVARINFTHATTEERNQAISTVREVRRLTGKNVAILWDTKGPEFRSGMLENDKITLVEGKTIRIVKDCVLGNQERFSVNHPEALNSLNIGDLLLLENDKMRITVTQIAGILARRIVSWVTLDDTMEKGQVYGLIKFASCTEIVVPRNVEIQVKKGDKVRGGESIIGRVIE